MKKLFVVTMLATSITLNLCAQHNDGRKVFEVPEEVVMNRRFDVALDKGNQLKLELTDITDLRLAANADSILEQFFVDIAGLKDSLADPLTAKRIDYILDAKGRKKIRLQQFPVKGSAYILDKGALASLRTEQDTIHIIVALVNGPAPEDKVSHPDKRYYHFTFFVNDLEDLKTYIDNGTLRGKMATIQSQYTSKWEKVPYYGNYQLKADPTIYSPLGRGQNTGEAFDYLTLLATVNIQNYKQYFVPSFSTGARVTLVNRTRTFKREIGLFWEPHFLFAKDAAGKLNTYRNDFLTLSFAQGGVIDHDPKKGFSFSTQVSLGYLIRKRGDYFDNNTFRAGLGQFNWQKTSIEPSIYFNNFFKGVTPGIRITQYF